MLRKFNKTNYYNFTMKQFSLFLKIWKIFLNFFKYHSIYINNLNLSTNFKKVRRLIIIFPNKTLLLHDNCNILKLFRNSRRSKIIYNFGNNLFTSQLTIINDLVLFFSKIKIITPNNWHLIESIIWYFSKINK